MQIAIKKVILRSVSKNAMKLFVHYSTLFFIAFLSMEHTKKQAFKLTTVQSRLSDTFGLRKNYY